MKVKINGESRKELALEEAKVAKIIIKDLEEDTSTVADYATQAIDAVYRAVGRIDRCLGVLDCSARIAKSGHTWNRYTEDSKSIDVWISATTQTTSGFCEIGVYLSRIWEIENGKLNPDLVYFKDYRPQDL